MKVRKITVLGIISFLVGCGGMHARGIAIVGDDSLPRKGHPHTHGEDHGDDYLGGFFRPALSAGLAAGGIAAAKAFRFDETVHIGLEVASHAHTLLAMVVAAYEAIREERLRRSVALVTLLALLCEDGRSLGCPHAVRAVVDGRYVVGVYTQDGGNRLDIEAIPVGRVEQLFSGSFYTATLRAALLLGRERKE